MPFNPGGVFSLIANYFAQPGTTIRTEQHNPPLEDIAASLSQVLIRDGRAPMTGALNMNGNEIRNIAASSAAGSVAIISQLVPVGAVLDWALKSPPPGWILCDGRVLLSNTPYQLLRNALIADGFTYGQDGSGNPYIPDYKGRTSFGRDDMGGSAAGRLTTAGSGIDGQALGAAGSSQTLNLSQSQLPAVSPSFTGSPSAVSVASTRGDVALGAVSFSTGGGAFFFSGISATGTVLSSGSVTPSGSVSQLGSGNPVSRTPAAIVSNKIIRVSYDA